MTDQTHSPVEPQGGSVLWTCEDADCEWTSSLLAPEAVRMSSFAQHLVAALAITTPSPQAGVPAAPVAININGALAARIAELETDLAAERAELEHVRGMMRPMVDYLSADSTRAAAAAPTNGPTAATEQPASSQAAEQPTPKTSPTETNDTAVDDTVATPSVTEMLDAVDGVVRTATDVVETAWPVLSKLLRGAAR